MNSRKKKMREEHFNSRLYTRGDWRHPHWENPSSRFQFTPLHERRHGVVVSQRQWPNDFNSRLYTRGDIEPRQRVQRHTNFNSRLYTRGDVWPAEIQLQPDEFQFTPLHERRQQKCTIFSIKST